MKKINGLKKGLIYALITTMIATSTIGTMPLNVSAATTGKVNTSALNVRSGAGTGYARVGSVTQGQTVTIVDSVKASDGYTWYKISGTTSGYVRGDYISNIVSDNVKSSTGTIIADLLNVRTGPGRNYTIIGAAPYGTRLTVISTSGGWYKVTCKVEGKIRTGYVSSDYVKLDSSPSSSSGSSNSGTSNNSGSGSGSTSNETIIATGVVNVSALHLRSGAGTSYSSITLLGNKTTVNILSQTGSWYKVTCTVNGSQKTGYVHSDYITKTASSNNNGTSQVTGQGVVNADVLNVRSGAGTSNSVLDKIYMNTKVEIVSQIGNWYSIKYTKNGTAKTGYVAAEYITRTAAVTPDPDETETKEPETQPQEPETETKEPETDAPTVTPEPEEPTYETKSGVLNGDGVRVRSDASLSAPTLGYVYKGDKVTIIGEEGDWYKVKAVVNGMPKEGYIYAEYVTVEDDSNSSTGNDNSGSTSTGKAGSVTGDGVYLRKGPSTSVGYYGQLSIGSIVTILGKEGDWYKVSCILNGFVKEGYIYSQWVKELGADDSDFDGEIDETFEQQIADFPESYKNSLRRLHEKYPNWNFIAYNTGMDFEAALEAQYDGELSMIYFDEGTTPFSWLSTKSEDYDWATDKYVDRDGPSWKSASKEILAYYMDPRNFLEEQQIFMFETMTYDESQSREVVAGILDGSFLEDGKGYSYNGQYYTYVDTFIEAGKEAKVSPYILASRSRQEIGSGSDSVTGTHGTYPNIYNFFNIGANASGNGGAVTNGLKYASQTGSWRRPWTNPWLAIVGGAEFLAESYIAKGQNTDYFQKFNVVSKPYHEHQYMGNIQAPSMEGSSRYGSYKAVGMLDGSFTFIIPVYDNMPSKASPMPIEAGNPNGYLKSLTISGMSLNQTFVYNKQDYYGATNQSSITVSAEAVSKYAKVISGTGTHYLNKGDNQIVVVCQADNGDRVTYTLNITRY